MTEHQGDSSYSIKLQHVHKENLAYFRSAAEKGRTNISDFKPPEFPSNFSIEWNPAVAYLAEMIKTFLVRNYPEVKFILEIKPHPPIEIGETSYKFDNIHLQITGKDEILFLTRFIDNEPAYLDNLILLCNNIGRQDGWVLRLRSGGFHYEKERELVPIDDEAISSMLFPC